jgi:hypothetical protein
MNTQQYALICLGEEATEVAHAVSKVLRFTTNDSAVIGGPSNAETLLKEYNDLLALAEVVTDLGIPVVRNQDMINAKKRKLLDYMNYSEQLGVMK